MSKKDILNYIIESNLTISFEQALIGILIAFLLGLFLYGVYKISFRGTLYSSEFATSLILIAMITTVIMETIQSNLALSLGMVGSLSIIRFRTAVKSPRDISFVFWAVCIGVSCGAGVFIPGIIGSIIIGIVAVIMSSRIYDKKTYVLIVHFELNVGGGGR